MNWKHTSDGRAVVSTEVELMPIDDKTPYDSIMILYSQHGVSRVGTLKKGEESLFHGWFPLPKNPGNLKEKHKWINAKR